MSSDGIVVAVVEFRVAHDDELENVSNSVVVLVVGLVVGLVGNGRFHLSGTESFQTIVQLIVVC